MTVLFLILYMPKSMPIMPPIVKVMSFIISWIQQICRYKIKITRRKHYVIS